MTHLVQNGEGNAGQVFVPALPPNGGPRRKWMNRLALELWWTPGGPPYTKKKNPPERASRNYLFLLEKMGRVRGIEPPTP